MTHKPLPPALVVMGPTAAGKTQLAVQLAQRLDGEIISVDSAQVYRGLDIGTAKPGPDERQGIPHHLIDILDPAESYSTGRFRRDALALVQDIGSRGKLPILAGGTMLYFNALFHGLAELPAADPELRRQLQQEAAARGSAALYAELARVDPISAARIHPHDPQRILRALEVFRISGVPLSAWWAAAKAEPPPFPMVKLVIAPADRADLHQRIRRRFLDMIQRGLIEEVRALYQRGDLHAGLPAIRAVGYRQVWAYLAGAWDKETMIERGIAATRQFAKRQFTWLRREHTALRYCSEERDLLDRVLRAVAPRLGR
ncbi:tRNA (adenosine(37)-N6)-dimethylallyltransferase MiaA [Candidatus Methylocalor cossyra]|uniref:tRNA dimethylallyltransferase n=1 Tax=Candidatus Methylocalor cossyra TaxID=3108543 RepID=A0ABP1C9I5_9GAMM